MSSSTHRDPGPSLPPGRGRRTRPSRRPTGRSVLPLAFAAWVVAEIWILIAVGEAAGGLTVLLLLLAGFVLGGVVIKRAGLRAWRRLAESVQQARDPAAEPTDPKSGRGGNALAMLGGVLVMVPGLLSDVAGLLCLFPPTANLIRRRAERSFGRRMSVSMPEGFEDSLRQARMHRSGGKVVPGEVIREDDDGNGRQDGGPSPQ